VRQRRAAVLAYPPLAASDDQSLRVPGKRLAERRARGVAVPELEAPIARSATMIDDPGQTHERASPAMQGRRIKLLHQIGDNDRARGTVKEDDLFLDHAAVEDHLVEVRRSGEIRRVTQLASERQNRDGGALGRATRRASPRATPAPNPRGEVMDSVRRYQMTDGAECVDGVGHWRVQCDG
jgi:hypothetical protein